MVVHVLISLAQGRGRAPAILRDHRGDARDVDPIGVLGVDDDLAVVHTLRYGVAALLPRAAVVGRAEDAARATLGLDRGVEVFRIRRRYAQSDAAEVAAR